jgi:hypothetical protein
MDLIPANLDRYDFNPKRKVMHMRLGDQPRQIK